MSVTWVISLEQIRRNNHRAADLLSLMSVLDKQAFPRSLLFSDAEEVELEKAKFRHGLHRQALSKGERTMGNEHPHTLSSVNSLAGVLHDQGKHEAAEKLNR